MPWIHEAPKSTAAPSSLIFVEAHRPPTLGLASTTVTTAPNCSKVLAQPMPATPAPITTTRGGSKGGCATFLRFLVLPQVCALWAPWQALHVEGGGASVAARGGGSPMASLFGGADVALPEVKPFFWRPPCFFAGAAPFDPFGAAGAAPVLGGIGPCCGSIVSWACSAGSAVVIDQTDQLRCVFAVYCGRARSFSIRASGGQNSV